MNHQPPTDPDRYVAADPTPFKSPASPPVTTNPNKAWTFRKLAAYPLSQSDKYRQFFFYGIAYLFLGITGLVHAYTLSYLWQTANGLSEGRLYPPPLSRDTFSARSFLNAAATLVLFAAVIFIPTFLIALGISATTAYATPIGTIAGIPTPNLQYLKWTLPIFFFFIPGVFVYCASNDDPLAIFTPTPYGRILTLRYLKTHFLLNMTFGVILVPAVLLAHFPLAGQLFGPLIAPYILWLLIIFTAAYTTAIVPTEKADPTPTDTPPADAQYAPRDPPRR